MKTLIIFALWAALIFGLSQAAKACDEVYLNVLENHGKVTDL